MRGNEMKIIFTNSRIRQSFSYSAFYATLYFFLKRSSSANPPLKVITSSQNSYALHELQIIYTYPKPLNTLWRHIPRHSAAVEKPFENFPVKLKSHCHRNSQQIISCCRACFIHPIRGDDRACMLYGDRKNTP